METKSLDYSPRSPGGMRSWSHILSLVSLGIGGLLLVVTPLVLSGPGGFVPHYLWIIAWCSVAIALSRRTLITIIALAAVLFTVAAARKDWERGLEFKAKQLTTATTHGSQ